MNSKRTNIYELIFSNGDRYIGVSYDLEKKLKSHKLKFKDDSIEIKLIMEVEESKKIYWERYYIYHYKKIGYTLRNESSGGEGVSQLNENSKLSEKLQILLSKEDLKTLYELMFTKSIENGMKRYSVSSYIRSIVKEHIKNESIEQFSLVNEQAKKIVQNFKNDSTKQ